MSCNYSTQLATLITPLIRRISEGENITAEEAEQAFDLLFAVDMEGYYWLAFTLALHTKGETIDELLGLCRSIEKLFGPKICLSNTIDISGTGGKPFKTINIGTVCAFILSGGGIKVAKQGSTAVTGLTGSLDIISNLGINLRYWSDHEKIKELLNDIDIAIYHSFLNGGKPHTRPAFISRMKEIGLTFISPFHIAGSIPSPVTLDFRIFGCYSLRYGRKIAELLVKMGCKRGLVISAEQGFDEISTFGKTNILEFDGAIITEYGLDCEQLSLPKTEPSSITSFSKENNMIDFLRILYGVERGAKRDIALANAAAGFYIAHKVANYPEGVKMAACIIDQGLAYKKLESFVERAGDMKALAYWKQKSQI
jgi:anthranilate phosphoribosyltransferase